MRQVDVLLGMEDITILYQYLYMDENNKIQIVNPYTKLEISMTDTGHFMCKNLSFPDLPLMKYDEQMTLPNITAMIQQLKESPAVYYPNSFESGWEEIKHLTNTTVGQQKYNLSKRSSKGI